MEYIKSIYDKASKYGICKIIPPTGWDPDFAIDLSVCLAISKCGCQTSHKHCLKCAVMPLYRANHASRDSISGHGVKNSTRLKEVSRQ
jgi:hypothetical protein